MHKIYDERSITAVNHCGDHNVRHGMGMLNTNVEHSHTTLSESFFPKALAKVAPQRLTQLPFSKAGPAATAVQLWHMCHSAVTAVLLV